MHHTFDIGIATKYDTSVAIFLNNLAFWVQKNMGNEKHFYEGKYWTYNSLDAFSLIFPYWSKDQLRTIIKKCLKHDLILIGNFNKQGYDRTQWFTLTDSGLALFPLMWENHHIKPSLMWENSHMDMVEIPYGCGEIPTPIPDIKTQIENPDRKLKEKLEKEKTSFPSGECTNNLVSLTPQNINKEPQVIDENYVYPETYYPTPTKTNTDSSKINSSELTIQTAYNLTTHELDTFERFWQLYPRKQGKERARMQWFHEKCHLKADEIMLKLTAQIKQDKAFIDGFVCNPERYLAEHKFEDEVFAPKKQKFDHDDTSWADESRKSIFE